MKRKILYILTTAVIGVTAFFVGKNFTEPTQQPETIQARPELMEMTVENGCLYLEYTDGTNFYSYWIPSEKLAEVLEKYCSCVKRPTGYVQRAGVDSAVQAALLEAKKDDVILAFGSLSYLYQVKAAYDRAVW